MEKIHEIDRLLLNRSGPFDSSCDEEIIETMVRLYRLGLQRLAHSILGDPDEAEDAAQQTLLRTVLRLHQYQPGSNFKAWLFNIAVNVCRGMLRKRRARLALQRLLARDQTRPSIGTGPEDSYAQDEAARQLWSAVDRLDDRQRLVLYLRFQQDLTIAEIAQVLGVREKTVYSRLYAALNRLRFQLGEQAGPHTDRLKMKGGGA